MKKAIIPIILILILIIVYFTIPRDNVDKGAGVYSNKTAGISFVIPEGYVLTEGEKGDAHRERHVITLVKKEDAAPRENSEGPAAITVTILQNNLDQQSLYNWYYGGNDANSKLSGSKYASTTVTGKEAVSFEWSGLYEAKGVAFRHNGNIIMVTMTYLGVNDPNHAAYEKILSSLSLSPLPPLTADQAISVVKGMGPEFDSYPSDNLPPKRVEAEMVPNGDWRIGFIMLGSGRPGILAAKCYNVTPAKEVTKTGELTVKTSDVVEKINLATCTKK